MATKTVYDLIKKQNGERFARAVRNYDNGIFDVPGIVDIVKYAGHDAGPIIKYLETLKRIHIQRVDEPKDPFELLHSVGYTAVYADTLAKQNAIMPYFAPGEALCTFDDDVRYRDFYIMNIVHKDAATLKREDFKQPQREDKYGTSVMSIQMLKTGGSICITNRYNHNVENPDNTYDSDPDNIVPGLSAALARYFNVDFSSQHMDLPDGYIRVGNRIVKYNMTRNDVYYGADFVVHNSRIIEIDKRSQFILDDFILDISKSGPQNRADFPNGAFGENISFARLWRNVVADKKLHVNKTESGATRISTDDGVWIDVMHGCIVGLDMPGVKSVPNGFLQNNRACKTIELPDVTKIGNHFLYSNTELMEISLPNVIDVGDDFLWHDRILSKVSMPNVERIGGCFLCDNKALQEIDLPKAREIGDRFLFTNVGLFKLNMPNVERIDDNFMADNKSLAEINMPHVRDVGANFLCLNEAVLTLNMPNVENIGDSFMYKNNVLTELDMPNVKDIGDDFLSNNVVLFGLHMPNVVNIGEGFLCANNGLTQLHMPQVREIGGSFLCLNDGISSIYMPNVESIGNWFMRNNTSLMTIDLPRIKKFGRGFLEHNSKILHVIASLDNNTALVRAAKCAAFDAGCDAVKEIAAKKWPYMDHDKGASHK